ncbi:MAG: hypothetical protein WA941_16655 [Nitrososphaeraceae archaeon]
MGVLRDRDQKRILDLEKRVQEQELENRELKRQLTLSSDKTNDKLNPTQEKIFHYVKGHSKIVKERVVQWCTEKQIASRVTALKAIKDLEQYGMIIVSTDRRYGANKQKHILFVNDSSLLIEIIEILDEFEKRYITLLEGISTAASAKNRWQSRSISDNDYISLILSTIKMHQHLLNVFSIYSLLVWPLKVKDEVMLARINVIFHNRILNIAKKISEKLHLRYRLPLLGKGTMEDMFGPLATNVEPYFTPLDLPEHDHIIANSRKFNLETQVESVLDTLWKFSYEMSPSIVDDYGFIRMTDFETKYKGSLKDRKTALMIWKKKRREEEDG